MMKKLTERDVIKLIREEYDRQLTSVLGELDTVGFKGDEEGNILSVGLKVRHEKSNLLYTVSSIGMDDIMLKTPEGEEFTVTRKELEKDYELD